MQYLHHCETVMSQYNITGKYSIALSSAMRNVQHNLLFELCEGVIYNTPKKCFEKNDAMILDQYYLCDLVCRFANFNIFTYCDTYCSLDNV